MAGTHGDLYSEIGKLVLAAHAGQTIDLADKSEELAHRYWNLGVPPESIAKAIARSLSAIGVSMALVSHRDQAAAAVNGGGPANGNGHAANGAAAANGGAERNGAPAPVPANGRDHDAGPDAAPADAARRGEAAAALFPSGVRLAVIS